MGVKRKAPEREVPERAKLCRTSWAQLFLNVQDAGGLLGAEDTFFYRAFWALEKTLRRSGTGLHAGTKKTATECDICLSILEPPFWDFLIEGLLTIPFEAFVSILVSFGEELSQLVSSRTRYCLRPLDESSTGPLRAQIRSLIVQRLNDQSRAELKSLTLTSRSKIIDLLLQDSFAAEISLSVSVIVALSKGCAVSAGAQSQLLRFISRVPRPSTDKLGGSEFSLGAPDDVLELAGVVVESRVPVTKWKNLKEMPSEFYGILVECVSLSTEDLIPFRFAMSSCLARAINLMTANTNPGQSRAMVCETVLKLCDWFNEEHFHRQLNELDVHSLTAAVWHRLNVTGTLRIGDSPSLESKFKNFLSSCDTQVLHGEKFKTRPESLQLILTVLTLALDQTPSMYDELMLRYGPIFFCAHDGVTIRFWRAVCLAALKLNDVKAFWSNLRKIIEIPEHKKIEKSAWDDVAVLAVFEDMGRRTIPGELNIVSVELIKLLEVTIEQKALEAINGRRLTRAIGHFIDGAYVQARRPLPDSLIQVWRASMSTIADDSTPSSIGPLPGEEHFSWRIRQICDLAYLSSNIAHYIVQCGFVKNSLELQTVTLSEEPSALLSDRLQSEDSTILQSMANVLNRNNIETHEELRALCSLSAVLHEDFLADKIISENIQPDLSWPDSVFESWARKASLKHIVRSVLSNALNNTDAVSTIMDKFYSALQWSPTRIIPLTTALLRALSKLLNEDCSLISLLMSARALHLIRSRPFVRSVPQALDVVKLVLQSLDGVCCSTTPAAVEDLLEIMKAICDWMSAEADCTGMLTSEQLESLASKLLSMTPSSLLEPAWSLLGQVAAGVGLGIHERELIRNNVLEDLVTLTCVEDSAISWAVRRLQMVTAASKEFELAISCCEQIVATDSKTAEGVAAQQVTGESAVVEDESPTKTNSPDEPAPASPDDPRDLMAESMCTSFERVSKLNERWAAHRDELYSQLISPARTQSLMCCAGTILRNIGERVMAQMADETTARLTVLMHIVGETLALGRAVLRAWNKRLLGRQLARAISYWKSVANVVTEFAEELARLLEVGSLLVARWYEERRQGSQCVGAPPVPLCTNLLKTAGTMVSVPWKIPQCDAHYLRNVVRAHCGSINQCVVCVAHVYVATREGRVRVALAQQWLTWTKNLQQLRQGDLPTGKLLSNSLRSWLRAKDVPTNINDEEEAELHDHAKEVIVYASRVLASPN